MNGKPDRIHASTIRPRLIFEVASEMVGYNDWPYRMIRVELGSQRDETEVFRLFGSASPDTIYEVADRKLDISMLNPSALLTLAYRGSAPFERPMPVAAITIIPSYDQLGFAVTERSGITSIDQIREQQTPLRVSVRGSQDPATSLLINVVLKAHGFSLEDIVSWGGRIFYDQSLPNSPSRLGRIESGELDAIFEEAISNWANLIKAAGMRFLSVDDEHLTKLEAHGFRRGTIEKSRYPTLPSDIQTVDFSGWPIFTHPEASDLLVRSFCAALESRKRVIHWQLTGPDQPPLPLERMCIDTEEGPLDVPLHPAAEHFWREKGYLT